MIGPRQEVHLGGMLHLHLLPVLVADANAFHFDFHLPNCCKQNATRTGSSSSSLLIRLEWCGVVVETGEGVLGLV